MSINIFMNNMVKNQPLLIISDIKIWRILTQVLKNCPRHLKIHHHTTLWNPNKLQSTTAFVAANEWGFDSFRQQSIGFIFFSNDKWLQYTLQKLSSICGGSNQEVRCTKHLICTHRISKFTISWIPAELSVTRLVEKITESMSTQKVGTFDNCCNAGCSKFKLIVVWHKTDYLRCSQFFWWKQWYFDQMHETFISQGTVVTFSDVVDRNKTFCKSSSGFCVWKIMPISWFLRGV